MRPLTAPRGRGRRQGEGLAPADRTSRVAYADEPAVHLALHVGHGIAPHEERLPRRIRRDDAEDGTSAGAGWWRYVWRRSRRAHGRRHREREERQGEHGPP